jgi:hypothetical protein
MDCSGRYRAPGIPCAPRAYCASRNLFFMMPVNADALGIGIDFHIQGNYHILEEILTAKSNKFQYKATFSLLPSSLLRPCQSSTLR